MFYEIHLTYNDGSVRSRYVTCIIKACDREDAEENIRRAYPNCSIESISPWRFRSTDVIEVACFKYI